MADLGEGAPRQSMSMGCHPDQVKQFNEDLKRHGITCARHTPDGVLEYTSKKARNQAMKHYGAFDKDAGYGDHAGDNV